MIDIKAGGDGRTKMWCADFASSLAQEGMMSTDDDLTPTAADGATPAPEYFVTGRLTDMLEGDGGETTVYSFKIGRSGEASTGQWVDWAVVGIGENPADADDFQYGVLPSGSVFFAPAHSTLNISVKVWGDVLFEDDEIFAVVITNPVNDAPDAMAIGTIRNDDVPVTSVISIAADQERVEESDPLPAPMTSVSFTVSRTGDLSQVQQVSWELQGNEHVDAVDAQDFSVKGLPSGTVVFGQGESAKTITMDLFGDRLHETQERIVVALFDPTNGASIGNARALTVVDDNNLDDWGHPTYDVSFTGGGPLEGDEGTTTTYHFRARRHGDLSYAERIDWAVTGGPSSDGRGPSDPADFVGGVFPSGSLRFDRGVPYIDFSVDIQGDDEVELREYFTVTISDPNKGGLIGKATAIGPVSNDDGVAIFEVAPLSADKFEGQPGTTTDFTFLITRSEDTSSAQRVYWRSNVTGANYHPEVPDVVNGPAEGSVRFEVGETEKIVAVKVIGDNLVEDDERLYFEVTVPGGTIILDNWAFGTIRNDDVPIISTISIAADQAAIYEGDTSATLATFTVTREGDLSRSQKVYWDARGSSSTPADGADFRGGEMPSGVVRFDPGESTQTITLRIAGDEVPEPQERFIIELHDPSSGAAIGTGLAAVSVRNDDQPGTISITADQAWVYEGDTSYAKASFTLTREGDSSEVQKVYWSTFGSGGTPADGADFHGGELPSSVVRFNVGETSKTITVHIAGDTIVETNERFFVELHDPTNGAVLDTYRAAVSIRNDDAAVTEISMQNDFGADWSQPGADPLLI